MLTIRYMYIAFAFKTDADGEQNWLQKGMRNLLEMMETFFNWIVVMVA